MIGAADGQNIMTSYRKCSFCGSGDAVAEVPGPIEKLCQSCSPKFKVRPSLPAVMSFSAEGNRKMTPLRASYLAKISSSSSKKGPLKSPRGLARLPASKSTGKFSSRNSKTPLAAIQSLQTITNTNIRLDAKVVTGGNNHGAFSPLESEAPSLTQGKDQLMSSSHEPLLASRKENNFPDIEALSSVTNSKYPEFQKENVGRQVVQVGSDPGAQHPVDVSKEVVTPKTRSTLEAAHSTLSVGPSVMADNAICRVAEISSEGGAQELAMVETTDVRRDGRKRSSWSEKGKILMKGLSCWAPPSQKSTPLARSLRSSAVKKAVAKVGGASALKEASDTVSPAGMKLMAGMQKASPSEVKMKTAKSAASPGIQNKSNLRGKTTTPVAGKRGPLQEQVKPKAEQEAAHQESAAKLSELKVTLEKIMEDNSQLQHLNHDYENRVSQLEELCTKLEEDGEAMVEARTCELLEKRELELNDVMATFKSEIITHIQSYVPADVREKLLIAFEVTEWRERARQLSKTPLSELKKTPTVDHRVYSPLTANACERVGLEGEALPSPAHTAALGCHLGNPTAQAHDEEGHTPRPAVTSPFQQVAATEHAMCTAWPLFGVTLDVVTTPGVSAGVVPPDNVDVRESQAKRRRLNVEGGAGLGSCSSSLDFGNDDIAARANVALSDVPRHVEVAASIEASDVGGGNGRPELGGEPSQSCTRVEGCDSGPSFTDDDVKILSLLPLALAGADMASEHASTQAQDCDTRCASEGQGPRQDMSVLEQAGGVGGDVLTALTAAEPSPGFQLLLEGLIAEAQSEAQLEAAGGELAPAQCQGHIGGTLPGDTRKASGPAGTLVGTGASAGGGDAFTWEEEVGTTAAPAPTPISRTPTSTPTSSPTSTPRLCGTLLMTRESEERLSRSLRKQLSPAMNLWEQHSIRRLGAGGRSGEEEAGEGVWVGADDDWWRAVSSADAAPPPGSTAKDLTGAFGSPLDSPAELSSKDSSPEKETAASTTTMATMTATASCAEAFDSDERRRLRDKSETVVSTVVGGCALEGLGLAADTLGGEGLPTDNKKRTDSARVGGEGEGGESEKGGIEGEHIDACDAAEEEEEEEGEEPLKRGRHNSGGKPKVLPAPPGPEGQSTRAGASGEPPMSVSLSASDARLAGNDGNATNDAPAVGPSGEVAGLMADQQAPGKREQQPNLGGEVTEASQGVGDFLTPTRAGRRWGGWGVGSPQPPGGSPSKFLLEFEEALADIVATARLVPCQMNTLPGQAPDGCTLPGAVAAAGTTAAERAEPKNSRMSCGESTEGEGSVPEMIWGQWLEVLMREGEEGMWEDVDVESFLLKCVAYPDGASLREGPQTGGARGGARTLTGRKTPRGRSELLTQSIMQSAFMRGGQCPWAHLLRGSYGAGGARSSGGGPCLHKLLMACTAHATCLCIVRNSDAVAGSLSVLRAAEGGGGGERQEAEADGRGEEEGEGERVPVQSAAAELQGVCTGESGEELTMPGSAPGQARGGAGLRGPLSGAGAEAPAAADLSVAVPPSFALLSQSAPPQESSPTLTTTTTTTAAITTTSSSSSNSNSGLQRTGETEGLHSALPLVGQDHASEADTAWFVLKVPCVPGKLCHMVPASSSAARWGALAEVILTGRGRPSLLGLGSASAPAGLQEASELASALRRAMATGGSLPVVGHRAAAHALADLLEAVAEDNRYAIACLLAEQVCLRLRAATGGLLSRAIWNVSRLNTLLLP